MSKKIEFATSFHDFYKTNGADRHTHNNEPSMTRQEFADECDLNQIMKRYEGQDIGAIMRRDTPPVYIDFEGVPDNLMDYLQMQKDAENAFMTLPAVVRKEFDNNPLEFVAFATDPENLDQMRTWGLAPPKAVEAPQAAPTQSAAPAAPAQAAPPSEAGKGSTHGST